MKTEKELFTEQPHFEKLVNIIRSNLRGLALDIGCGNGIITSTHHNILGFDVGKQDSYIPLIIGDMHHLPFKNGVFDTVVISHVLEHSTNPEKLLSEINRIIRLNGILICAIPNARSWAVIIRRPFGKYDGYAYRNNYENKFMIHHNFWGSKELKYLLKSHNFDCICIYGTTPMLIISLDKLFIKGFLKKIYWKLGDLDKYHSKDIVAIAKKN